MKRNEMANVQVVGVRSKIGAALFIIGPLCLILAGRSMGDPTPTPTSTPTPTPCDFFVIHSEVPMPELNATYSPYPNYPNLCPSYTDTGCVDPDPCQGGLYVDSSNQPSNQNADHFSDGMDAADDITTLNGDGNYNPNGKVVLLSMGMCNAWLKFGADLGGHSFIDQVCPGGQAPCTDLSINSHLVIVNGAQAGQDAKKWANPNSTAWKTIWDDSDPNHPTGRLATAGVTPAQVQAIWCEHALIFDTDPGHTSICKPFPQHADLLRDAIEQTLKNIHTKFINCKVVYISPRAYAYTLATHNPEPKAYQNGFADKWVIMDQINDRNGVGDDMVPWINWGPYLWTNGETPRADHLTWLCNQDVPTQSDVQDDLVHPSTYGVDKVAKQLIAFFKTDPTATQWFLRPNSPNENPVATISPTLPKTISTTHVTSFSAAITNSNHPIVSYLWTFDDGESATIQNPTRKFPIPGQYNIRFTAIDSVGNHAYATGVLTVQ